MGVGEGGMRVNLGVVMWKLVSDGWWFCGRKKSLGLLSWVDEVLVGSWRWSFMN